MIHGGSKGWLIMISLFSPLFSV